MDGGSVVLCAWGGLSSGDEGWWVDVCVNASWAGGGGDGKEGGGGGDASGGAHPAGLASVRVAGAAVPPTGRPFAMLNLFYLGGISQSTVTKCDPLSRSAPCVGPPASPSGKKLPRLLL